MLCIFKNLKHIFAAQFKEMKRETHGSVGEWLKPPVC